MEGRRHSVDLPISKTLVALRRVRSLKDPSTISTSKFSSLLDNVNWETNSNNGISLRFLEENHASHHHHHHRNRMIEESDCPWNQKKKPLGVIPSIDPLEGVESSNEPSLGSLRERIMDRIALRREFESKSGNSDSNSVSVSADDDDVADEILPDSDATVARSLGQKFRPRSFSELVGQSVVARSLLGAIRRGRVTSLYIFHGPRGTGKSSAARIFAAALNCLGPDSDSSEKPCGFCRECIAFFSGRCRDVREVDSVSIDGRERIRSLMNEAAVPPVSSRFKVFIVDECQSLRGETWAAILHGLDDGLSRRVVFVMIAPELEGLPRGALSRSQRYHFPKIKDSEIAGRLARICVEEGFDFERDALEFVASKSGGSMRDAEMMLDQLSLLGRKITVSLAYELVGVVSDGELLDLLDLAMSSDSSRTVIRARELMRSRIDPMQLVSQLANLIMDILAGSQEDCSEVSRKFFSKHASEVELQKLSHALKILSETEKQLRMSKNQTTWLTVALLQLSSLECSPTEANNSKFWIENGHERGEEGMNHLENCSSVEHKSDESETTEDQRRTLESIWKRTVESCQSPSLRKFLIEQGKLSSLLVSQGVAVAELEFCHPDCVAKAEKSLRQISDALRSVLGCNVVIRINLVSYASHSMYAKMKSASQRLFGCSRRIPYLSPDREIENARSVIPVSCDERSSTSENNNNILAPVSAEVSSLEQPKNWTRCFPRKLRSHKKKPRSSEEQNKLALAIMGRASVDENALREDSELSHCWRTLHLRKAWRSRHQRENSCLAEWVSRCGCCGTK